MQAFSRRNTGSRQGQAQAPGEWQARRGESAYA